MRLLLAAVWVSVICAACKDAEHAVSESVGDSALALRCDVGESPQQCVLYGPSLVDLISNPMRYHGKRVRTSGYGILEFEGDALYISQEDERHGLTRNGVWIALRDTSLVPAGWKSGYVLVEGQFNAKSRGHLGLFSGEIMDIDRFSPWVSGDPTIMVESDDR